MHRALEILTRYTEIIDFFPIKLDISVTIDTQIGARYSIG
jgi:hypothetical protein